MTTRTIPRFRFLWVPICLTLLASSVFADRLDLESGEILIGQILSENEHSITIDSAALGVVTVNLAGATIVRDEIVVSQETVSSIEATEPASESRNNWLRRTVPRSITGSLDIGLDMSNSDVKVRSYMFEAGLRWKVEENEVQTRHYYEYLSIDGNRATDTYENSVRWIRTLSPRWILLSQGNWLRDEGKGIDYRVDVLSVAGYYFVKSEKITLLGGIGPAYEWERWDRLGEEGSETFNIAAYELFRYRFTPQLTFEQIFLGYVSPSHAHDRRHHVEASLRQMLTPSMSIGLKYSLDYDNTPPPGYPKDQDRLTATIGYDF